MDRYQLYYTDMVEDDEGEWVKYDDYIKELESLKDKVSGNNWDAIPSWKKDCE